MKVLKLEQNGEIEGFAKIRWNQNLKKVTSQPFDLVAEKYPFVLINIEEKDFPPWGYAFYRKNEEGMLELFKENWDTSG